MSEFFSFDDYGGIDAAPAGGVWETPGYDTFAGGVDLGTGWAETLQGLAKTAVGVWGQSTLMQKNQDGQRYLEGQRYLYARQGQAVGGINSGTLLLLGGAALLFAMLKD